MRIFHLYSSTWLSISYKVPNFITSAISKDHCKIKQQVFYEFEHLQQAASATYTIADISSKTNLRHLSPCRYNKFSFCQGYLRFWFDSPKKAGVVIRRRRGPPWLSLPVDLWIIRNNKRAETRSSLYMAHIYLLLIALFADEENMSGGFMAAEHGFVVHSAMFHNTSTFSPLITFSLRERSRGITTVPLSILFGLVFVFHFGSTYISRFGRTERIVKKKNNHYYATRQLERYLTALFYNLLRDAFLMREALRYNINTSNLDWFRRANYTGRN